MKEYKAIVDAISSRVTMLKQVITGEHTPELDRIIAKSQLAILHSVIMEQPDEQMAEIIEFSKYR